MRPKPETAMPTPVRILDAIQDKIGTFWGVGTAPPPGTTQATVTAEMPAAQVADPSNHLRLAVWADFGAGSRFMAVSPDWQGGPGKSAPSLAWQFNPSSPPQLVYGVLENGTAGATSAAVAGLTITFA